MRERGWGRVLYIASDSAVVIPAEMIHYGVSKTALLGVGRGFAKEAAGSGVTVNCVVAGPTHTEGVEDFVYQLVDRDLPWDEAQRAFMPRGVPQLAPGLRHHRCGRPRRRRVRRLDPPVALAASPPRHGGPRAAPARPKYRSMPQRGHVPLENAKALTGCVHFP